MLNQDKYIFDKLNQVLIYLVEGKMDFAIEQFDKIESEMLNNGDNNEFFVNFRIFIKQYRDGSVFLNSIANGNLEVYPPIDPHRENYMISQYKQLHSNLLHLTWQMQQIGKGNFKQKVSFLGDFSIAFNEMMDSLREKKQLKEKIELQFVQLQELNATKDKFFSIISHDLRSPFNSFLGLTQIMAEELPNLTMDEIQKFADSMRKSATNLYRLLENLLEWSQIQQGLIPYNPELIRLLPVVKESVEMILESAKNKQIEIIFDIPPDIEVYAENNSLQTIIRNLVSNAVKFTPKGGNIHIFAKSNPDNSVEISVNDSGIGMKPAMIENLFKLDVSTSRKGTEGELSTGLGLFICKEFIEKHGGKLWVESQEGKGSTFTFLLPFMQ